MRDRLVLSGKLWESVNSHFVNSFKSSPGLFGKKKRLSSETHQTQQVARLIVTRECLKIQSQKIQISAQRKRKRRDKKTTASHMQGGKTIVKEKTNGAQKFIVFRRWIRPVEDRERQYLKKLFQLELVRLSIVKFSGNTANILRKIKATSCQWQKSRNEIARSLEIRNIKSRVYFWKLVRPTTLTTPKDGKTRKTHQLSYSVKAQNDNRAIFLTYCFDLEEGSCGWWISYAGCLVLRDGLYLFCLNLSFKFMKTVTFASSSLVHLVFVSFLLFSW